MAESKGWSVDEASRQRDLADQTGVLQALFMERYPNDFAGAYLGKHPSEPPVFRFKSEIPKGALEAIADSGLVTKIEEGVGKSLEEMHADMVEGHRQLMSLGFGDVAAWVDQINGRVVLQVRQTGEMPHDSDEVRRRLSRELRDRVEIEVMSDAPLATPAHTRGGNWMLDGGVKECTSGWSVERVSDGLDGVALAAHCEGIDQFEDAVSVYLAPFRAEHIGAWGEVEWHTTTHVELPEFYATSTQIRDVTSVEAYNQIVVGESVCVYGRASNSRNCGTDVLHNRFLLSFQWDGCGGCTVVADRMVHMDGRAGVTFGDSGGGWSWNNRAYGITFGWADSDNGALWSAAGNLPNALGVRVLTQ